MLRRMFEVRSDERTGDCRNMHNEEPQNARGLGRPRHKWKVILKQILIKYTEKT